MMDDSIFDAWRTSILNVGGVDPDSLIIARDVQGRDRSYKEFRFYRNFSDYEVHLYGTQLYQLGDATNINHLYEVIPCGFSTPVWFFADHDCKETEAEGMSEIQFLETICRMYYEYFNIGPDEINRTLFVSSTCRPGKLSVHIKINIKTTLMESKDHAVEISKRCNDRRCCPDLSVYSSRFQQIRAAGSSKIGSCIPKTPVFVKGRMNYTHHMVRINPSSQVTELIRSPVKPTRIKYVSNAIRVREEDKIRIALKSSDLPNYFGPVFDSDSCHIEDTRMEDENKLSCYIDGSGRRGWTLMCPFAKRVHKSNRSRIYLRRTGEGYGEIEYRCLSPNCQQEKKRIVLPYDLRKT